MAVAGLLCAATAGAQTPEAESRAPAPTVSQKAQERSTADEDFELNIVERRITEDNYEASLSVAVGEDSGRGVDLRVGVAVGASRIDVLLRNVRGRVRFRATLEQILRRLDGRRAAGAPHAEAPTPDSPLPLK
jgi:hypothetical protein